MSEELRLERGASDSYPRLMRNPFKYFKTSPEVIRLAVMMYVRFPLSLRNVEDLNNRGHVPFSTNTLTLRPSKRDGSREGTGYARAPERRLIHKPLVGQQAVSASSAQG